MTDAEIQTVRERKDAVAKHLQSIDLSKYRSQVDDTDERIGIYIRDVIAHPDDHNLRELQAMKRFFSLCDKYEWKRKRVKKFMVFYEALPYPTPTGMANLHLTPILAFMFACIFGWVNERGYRLIRNVIWEVPRKFGKTTDVVALCAYEILFMEYTAECYVCANSYDQAQIMFGILKDVMLALDPNQKTFRVNREKIFYQNGERKSKAECLTSNSRTKDGKNASLGLFDEYSQAVDKKNVSGAALKNTITSSAGARKEPLFVTITTASDVLDGPFMREREGAFRVLDEEIENDTCFFMFFEPDPWDDIGDPHTWHKVQPHLGVTVQEDYYQKAYSDALLSHDEMMTFKTKQLNMFTVNEVKSWFSIDKARSLMGDFDIEKVKKGTECAVSFDLSVHDDFSAVSYTLYDKSSQKFYTHTDYYFPEGALASHPNNELYKLWHEQGHLKFCSGDCIDVRMIAEDIVKRSRYLRIIRIAYDSYKSQDLTNILATFGRDVLQPYSQTYGSFNLPTESFEMMAWADPPKIVLNNNPINAYCLYNCQIDSDRLDNKKPIKISHTRKIDGVITMLMGIGSLYQYER